MGGGGGGGATPVASSEGQTYCLRWNNHQTNLVQILHALHEVGSYVDCTLVVDDEQFKAHRVVLAANSPYFQHILQDVPQDHCSIILPGVKGFEIAALLQYMYTGETTVTKSQEPEILRTAKELQVKGLYDNLMKFNNNKPGAGASAAAADERVHYNASSLVPTSSSGGSGKPQNGESFDHHHHHHHHHHQQQQQQQQQQPSSHHNSSSSVISTSTHISPSAAISSSCSPPPPPFGAYQQPPYTNFGPSGTSHPHIPAGETPLTPSHATPHAAAGEPGPWPLSPSAAAAAMLNSVYESAADMNPLKRKKLSAISSMLLNSTRDTPILRNVLAQANPADSSQQQQPNPLLLKSSSSSSLAEKSTPHQSGGGGGGGGGAGGGGGTGSHSFNGSDYGGDKEPLSPHTDRSFDEETGGPGGKKPEWKRYKQYTRADMMCAIQAVREGMSALQASRKYGLPSRTLYDKVRKLNITTGRGTHRTPKRSPPGVESSAAFPYSAAAAAAAAHNYGHGAELLERSEQAKEHSSHHPHHGMPPTISHSAAALLDHAFLQQALENRGGDMAGREALHAMALAAAAHAAANRMSASPPGSGSNGHPHGARSRSPSPSPRHYGGDLEMHEAKHERLIKREREQDEREDADADDEEDQDHDHVEDLSLARKERPESPYSPPPPRASSPLEGASVIMHHSSNSTSTNGKEHEDYPGSASSPPPPPPQLPVGLGLGLGLKRELMGSEETQARTD